MKRAETIAIVDMEGEGMIFSTAAREQEAVLRVQAKIATLEKPPAPGSNEYKALFYARDAFYDAELVHLDALNPGADLALAYLRERYDVLYVLTSCPHFLAPAVEANFRRYSLPWDKSGIRFKLYAVDNDKREQYTPTAVWKSIIVRQASDWYDHVLFVDNEKRNLDAVTAQKLPNVQVRDSLVAFATG